MSYEELFTQLKTLDIPVAYDHFNSNKDIKPPFMVYRAISPNTFKADGITFYRPYNYEIELVTEKKEPSIEDTIEQLLTTNNIPYDINDEIWDEDERIYHNFYEI